jgi:hypothetical protein
MIRNVIAVHNGSLMSALPTRYATAATNTPGRIG